MNPIVYLPIEIQVRELPSRLLIAAHLLGAGYAVVIGSHWSLVTGANQAALPAGAYLFKTVNRIQGDAMTLARANGHLPMATDEEVLIFTEDSGYTGAFSDVAAEACQLFFAQSPAHQDAVTRKFPHLAGKIRVTGNPRVDLLLPQNRAAFDTADARVADAQPYILFNTNYANINSIWNDSHGIAAAAQASGAFDGPDREAKIAMFNAITEWERVNFHAMTTLMDWAVRNITGLKVVVRPHPVERHRHWEKMLANVPNAQVILRSDPHPWITGSKLVVHTGCTTGLEAALLGAPALNLMPGDFPASGTILGAVNPTFRRWEDAAQAITDYFTKASGPLTGHEARTAAALQAHLPTYRDNAAARLIAAAIADTLRANGAAPGAFDFTLKSPLVEKPAHELRKQKYDAGAEEIQSGLGKAAMLAGVMLQASFENLGAGLFLVKPQ